MHTCMHIEDKACRGHAWIARAFRRGAGFTRAFRRFDNGGRCDFATDETTNKLRISTYGRGIWEVDAVQCVAETPMITVEGESAICTGDSVVLTASDGYESYIWSNGMAGQQITLSNFSQTGEYNVSVQDNDGSFFEPSH